MHTDHTVVFTYTETFLYRLKPSPIVLAPAVVGKVDDIKTFLLPALDDLHVKLLRLGCNTESRIIVAIIIEESTTTQAWSANRYVGHVVIFERMYLSGNMRQLFAILDRRI